MKNLKLSGLFFFLAAGLFAQSANTLQTTHYELTAEAGAESSLERLGRELEKRYEVFNDLFRFKPAPDLLKVRLFLDSASYDAYVIARLGTTRSGGVYLHYNQPERRELVILHGSAEESATLPHQAFVQFLRGSIPNPPTWMREGFAIYFNSVTYDAEKDALLYEENLAWLSSVKSLGANSINPRELFLADTLTYSEAAASGVTAGRFSRDFQICSWALVSFLLNSGEYFRTLTESFMLLSADSTAAENSQAVMNRFSLWTDINILEKNYSAYLNSRRTFTELMEGGRTAYAAGDAMNAELAFLAALDQRPKHYGPYYYLGLIYYEEKLYDMAEQHYLLSLEYGADEALTAYAIGVNAMAAGRADDAGTWLEKAAVLDPARYRAKAEDLLRNHN